LVDYRVTFKGDLGNLAQFDTAIRNSVQQSARAIEQANKSLLAQVGNISGIFNPQTSGAGLFVSKLNTQIDGVNRTLIHSGEIVRRVTADYELAVNSAGRLSVKPIFADVYKSPYTKIIGDLDKIEAAQAKQGPIEQKILADREASLARTIPLEERVLALQELQGAQLAKRKSAITTTGIYTTPVQNQLNKAIKEQALIPPTDTAALAAGSKNIANLRYELAQIKASGAAALAPIDSEILKINAEIDALGIKIARIGTAQEIRAARLRSTSPAYDQQLTTSGLPNSKLQAKILEDTQQTLQKIIPLQEKIVGLYQKESEINARRAAQVKETQAKTAPLESQISQLQTARTAIDPTDTAALRTNQRQINSLTKQLGVLNKEGAAALKPFDAELKVVDKDIARTTLAAERLNTALAKRTYSTASKITPPAGPVYGPPVPGELTQAYESTPPIQAQLANVSKTSPELLKRLQREGLGGGYQAGTEEFKKALAQQEAAVTHYTENIRTGTKLVRGSWIDNVGVGATGVAKEFSIELDKQGKVIGRWGGQLAGASQFLRQTVRDFTKVIEWTVATTAVFGTLATVVGQLKTINELNSSLAHLAITAQTSVGDTAKLFSALGQVAVQTATPLNELVKVADDIALATKQAGDSTQEWQGKIIDLTRAVGIFTNLAGVDTVQAADQLSAAFKQLGIAPSELVGVLSKVTAVAGGQSTAIADIVKGLSSVSEAAKAAGLSLDEQISSIQVLSQVTNKSSDEIATSFKNLFGSVSSVGSEKILKEFGINIRDAQGGMRGFLDIYRDVKQALDSGVIPQNRLSDVLRGIAGGPRRAPDAAALLENIGRIDATVGTSINATNEALIANAKILDTNTAKIQQFKNSVDIVVFEKFGKVVQDLISTLTDFGNVLLGILKAPNAAFYSLIVNLGAILLLMKGFGAVIRTLGIDSLSASVLKLSTSFKTLAISSSSAATALPAATGPGTVIPLGPGAGPGGIRGLLSKFGGNKALIAGALTAGAVGAASIAQGGINAGTVGTVTQMAGALALTLGVSAPLGVALLGLGTVLQLVSNDSTAVAESQKDLRSSLLTGIDTLKAAQYETNNLVKAQEDAEKVVTRLQEKGKLTSSEQAQLTTATKDYVNAAITLIDANSKVSDSFNDVLDKIQKLNGVDYSHFKDIAAGLNPDSPEIQKLRQQLIEDLLKSTGQSIYSGKTLTPSSTFVPFTDNGTSTLARSKGGLYGNYDISRLSTNPGELKQLFNGDGTPNYTIPENKVSLTYLQEALTQVSTDLNKYGVSQDQFDMLTKAINNLAETSSTSAQNAAIVQQTNAQVQANSILGIFNADQTKNANTDVTLLGKIQKAQEGVPTTYSPTGSAVTTPEVDALQKQFVEIKKAAEQGLTVPNATLKSIATNILSVTKGGAGFASKLEEIGSKGKEALDLGIYSYLKNAGVSQEQLNSYAAQYKLNLQAIADIIPEISQAFEDARKAAQTSFADRSLQLLIQKNSGQFKGNESGYKELTDINNEALKSNNKLIDSVEKMSGTALVEFNNALTGIIGLQGDYITGNEDWLNQSGELEKHVTSLTSKLISNAEAAGVNASGLAQIRIEAEKLVAISALIDSYHEIIIHVKTVYENIGNNPATAYLSAAAAQVLTDSSNKAKSQLSDAEKQLKAVQKIINQINASGKGSNIGGSSKSSGSSGKTGPNVSTLDIPDEVASATNRSALLQEAIKRARALQSQIPGATKDAKNDVVELLKGTQRILEVRGVKDDYLRKALEELAAIEKKRLDFETKADTIRRIRVGAGDFSAIANVPVNSQTGVSLGGPQGPVNITLNLNGTILTPAQLAQFGDLIAASLKRQIANG